MNAFQQFSKDFREYMEENKLTTKRLSTTKKFIPVGPYNLERLLRYLKRTAGQYT